MTTVFRTMYSKSTNNIAVMWNTDQTPTVVLELKHVLVELTDPLGALWEADAVPCHGVPVADRTQLTLVVVSGQVIKHRRVVYECIDLAAINQQ